MIEGIFALFLLLGRKHSVISHKCGVVLAVGFFFSFFLSSSFFFLVDACYQVEQLPSILQLLGVFIMSGC
jgi:hypothetical protein